jgi:hypothetical protein
VIGRDVLEVELRSLPGVTSVAVDDTQVSVLGLPDTEADVLRVLVSAVLATHAMDRTVRVLGGKARPVARRRPRRLAAVTACVMILAGVAAAVTGLAPNVATSESVRESLPASIGGSASDPSWVRPTAMLPIQEPQPSAAVLVPVATRAPSPKAVTAPPLETSVVAAAAPIVKAPPIPHVTPMEAASAVVLSGSGSGPDELDRGPRSGTNRAAHHAHRSSATKAPGHGRS